MASPLFSEGLIPTTAFLLFRYPGQCLQPPAKHVHIYHASLATQQITVINAHMSPLPPGEPVLPLLVYGPVDFPVTHSEPRPAALSYGFSLLTCDHHQLFPPSLAFFY